MCVRAHVPHPQLGLIHGNNSLSLTMALSTRPTYLGSPLRAVSVAGSRRKFRLLSKIARQMFRMSPSNCSKQNRILRWKKWQAVLAHSGAGGSAGEKHDKCLGPCTLWPPERRVAEEQPPPPAFHPVNLSRALAIQEGE